MVWIHGNTYQMGDATDGRLEFLGMLETLLNCCYGTDPLALVYITLVRNIFFKE